MTHITIPEWMSFGTPQSCQGQMIEESYGVDLQAGLVVRRSADRSTGETTWWVADLTEEEQDELEYYDAGGSVSEPDVAAPYVQALVSMPDDVGVRS